MCWARRSLSCARVEPAALDQPIERDRHVQRTDVEGLKISSIKITLTLALCAPTFAHAQTA